MTDIKYEEAITFLALKYGTLGNAVNTYFIDDNLPAIEKEYVLMYMNRLTNERRHLRSI